jgi:hypothetical protein
VALTKEDADAMTARGAAVDVCDREHNDPLRGVFAAKAVIGQATYRRYRLQHAHDLCPDPTRSLQVSRGVVSDHRANL